MAVDHITFIRDSDRTRVVFVLGANEVECPEGFRLAGARVHDGGPIVIPADGDDYGGSGVPVYNAQLIWPS